MKCPTKSAKWRGMPLLYIEGLIFILSSQSHWYTYYDCIPVQIHASEENIVIARLQGKSFKKHWWHISKHAWYVLFSINTLGNVWQVIHAPYLWVIFEIHFMGQMKCFLEKFELTFINKRKGDVWQQVLKRSFCLNYRFFPPGDNFNARSSFLFRRL